MNDIRIISPAEGRRVLDPARGTPIGAATPVAWTSYWQRRLDAGDVILADEEIIETGGAAPPVVSSRKGARK